MKYIIVIDKQPRTNPSADKKEIAFEIDELRKKGNVHDDFIIEQGMAKVIRRIEITKYNVTKILENEVIQNLGEAKLPLFEGDNYIYVKDEYSNNLCAEYIVKSDFTDMYVTNLKMESAIEESARQINLFVSQTLESYSTTEETKALIQLQANQIKEEVSNQYATKEGLAEERSERIQKANEITQTVSKKVGNDEIISKINQSAEKVAINADKIDIDGKAVHFKTNISKTIGPFTENDYNKVRNYIMETGTLNNEELKKYDISGDGKIDSLDILYIRKAINNGGYLTFSGTYEIDPYSKDRTFALYDNRLKNYSSIISLVYNYFDYLYAGGMDINGQLIVRNEYGEMFTQDNNNAFELYVDGDIRSEKKIYCTTLTQTSLKSKKKYIKKLKVNATDLIKNSDICLYNLKGEKAKSKKHIGLVIGDGYNCPEEVISEDGQGVEQYSMTSLAWKAIQEQQEIIENLKQRIEKLEAK